MSPRSKKEYVEAVFLRYKRATRSQKKVILDEFCRTLGYHRKHAIRVLRRFKRFTAPKPKHRGRRPYYRREEILKPLKQIWLAANLPCSKRLKAILPLRLPGYSQAFTPLAPKVIRALCSISAATIDRILKPVRVRYKMHGRTTTKPGTLLRTQIPIKANQWDETRPGYLEADTVAHCGTSLLGTFAYTIDFVDIATGWTEQRAVWGKGEAAVLDQIHKVEQCLPFPLLGFDSDNGGEFLNYHLVRQWLGYARLDNPAVVPLLNDLYAGEWRLFHNFFCPSVKLLSKERVGSKTIKRHDSPKTPYQRIMASPHIDLSTKRRLSKEFSSLNPFLLRRAMERKPQRIFTCCDNSSMHVNDPSQAQNKNYLR